MATEKRLIDANALRKEIDLCDIETFNDKFTICEQIAIAPTVDAVEVVRCKDCRYCMKDYHGLWCFNDYEHNLQPNDFCSRGEKKDGDGDA